MQGYVPGEQPGDDPKIIKLNTNENPYPPSPRVANAIHKELGATGERLRLYSDPSAQELREAAAACFGFNREHILAGNGSDELLSLVMRTFVEPSEQIAYAVPTYSLYATLAAAHGVQAATTYFPGDYTLPQALSESPAKIVFVASPNSPSGTAYDTRTLRSLARRIRGILVIDEAYADFADENALSLAQTEPNVIVLRTFSKSYSLAGLRIGLMFANSSLIEGVAKVKDSYNLDRLALVAGTAALQDTQWLQTNVARIRNTRQKLSLRLEELGLEVLPSQANFVFARLATSTRAKQVFDHLKANHILVRYFPQRPLADGLRITVGTDKEIDLLLDVFASFLAKENRKP